MKIIENRKKYFLASSVLILIGLTTMIVNMAIGNGAFNYDIDFTGGTEIQMDIGQDFLNEDIIAIVQETTGEQSPHVQRIVGTNIVSVRIREIESTDLLFEAINEKYGIEDNSGKSVEFFSAAVSSEMRTSSLLAITVASILMLIYVSIRFKDFKTGISAIIALVHDALIVLTFYAVFRIPINTAFIAAILTILGYSINATIVVFDRIRENKNIMRRESNDIVINTSINQSMRRSIYTSITTLITIVCLYIFGVPSIQQFTLPIIIGIISGTYSSVFLAGSTLYSFSNTKK